MRAMRDNSETGHLLMEEGIRINQAFRCVSMENVDVEQMTLDRDHSTVAFRTVQIGNSPQQMRQFLKQIRQALGLPRSA